jgi:hypothetical protein
VLPLTVPPPEPPPPTKNTSTAETLDGTVKVPVELNTLTF